MTSLPTNTLGRTGLTVSKLGYGAMELRGPGGRLGRDLDPAQAGTLLNQVLDAGITFIDTSPDYGRAEELIGEHVSHRRDQFFLASKCGCAVHPDGGTGGFGEHVFTRANVRAGVEQSLRRMRTDHLDVVQFHASPSRATLEENDSVGELVALRGEGKIRFIGMSGTLPNIEDHVAGLDDLLDGMTRMEFMLRFTISHPDMHTTIVGTAKPAHLADNLAAATKGPLPGEVYEEAKRRLS